MSLEEDSNKIFKDDAIQKVRSIKNLRMHIPLKERSYYRAKFGHSYSIVSLSLIKGSN